MRALDEMGAPSDVGQMRTAGQENHRADSTAMRYEARREGTVKNFIRCVGVVVLSLGVAGCGPTVGESCSAGTGACENAQTFLECSPGGQLRRVPCRGPKGCTTTGNFAACDLSIGVEGDPCGANTAGGACAMGGRAELFCDSGVFKKRRDCVTCDVTATNQVNCTEPCGPTTCAGCCLNGTCQAGVGNSACGKGGSACSTCAAGEVCGAEQRCSFDPNGMWVVQPTQFEIATTNAGATWDVGAGAPDPYASLACPATSMMRVFTETANDSFMGTWRMGSCRMRASDLIATGFSIGVFDEDISDDDTIASAGTIRVSEANLAAGSITLNNSTTLRRLVVQLRRE